MSVLEQTLGSDGIAILTLNRPDRLNALDPELLGEFSSVLVQLATDVRAKAIVVTGSGRAFCSGADLISFLSQAGLEQSPVAQQVGRSMDVAFNPLVRALMEFPKPVVTAINGMAAGGGAAIALCADVIVAGQSAKLKFVQVPQLGCVADLGGNWLLQRIAGRSVALATVLLGETISADRAERLGMFWEVVEDSELLNRACDIARALARVPREAVIASRRLVDLSTTATFADMLDLERLYQQDLALKPELVETVKAFMASRG